MENDLLKKSINKSLWLIKERSGVAHDTLNYDEYLSISSGNFLDTDEYISTGSLLIFYLSILEWLFGAGGFLILHKDLLTMVKVVFEMSAQEKDDAKKFLLDAIKTSLYDAFFDEGWTRPYSEKIKIQNFLNDHLREIKNVGWIDIFDPVYEVLTLKFEKSDTATSQIKEKISNFYRKFEK